MIRKTDGGEGLWLYPAFRKVVPSNSLDLRSYYDTSRL
jgi:hypothetical protein